MLSSQAIALNPERQSSQFLIEHFGRKEGLPSDRVWVSREGPRGYLWIGTAGGLARFDGVKFTIFNEQTNEAFTANDVRDLEWTPGGDLWIGTYGGGALLMRGNEFHRIGPEQGLAGNVIYDIHRASDGALWFGTENGVSRLEGTEFRSWGPDDGLAAARTLKIAESDDGTIWFSSLTDGVSYFDGERFRSDIQNLDSPEIHMLSNDSRLGILVGTATGKVFQQTGPGRLAPVSLNVGAPVEESMTDRDGNRWLATYGNGLWRLRANGQRERFTLNFDSETVLTFDLQEDRRGSLWISTPRGLIAVRDTPFLALGTREALADSTFVVTGGTDGTLWAGTEGRGLFRRRPNGTIDQPYAELTDVSISSLFVSNDGTLWVGTFGAGLYTADNGSLRHYTEADGLSGMHVFAIEEARDGAIWVSTDTGLDTFDTVTKTASPAPVALAGALVRHILSGRDNRMWLSSNQGVFEVDGERTRRWSVDDGLPSNSISASYEDDRGVIWIASTEGGLSRLYEAQLFSYGREQGLAQLSAFEILEDRSRNLWVSTISGLLRISRDSLDAVARGDQEHLQLRLFDETDGLRSTQFVGGFQSGSWAAPDNHLWFASNRGLTAFLPEALAGEDPVLQSYVEAVRVNGVSLPLDELIELPADLQSLEIDYSAPELGNPRAISFRYAIGDNRPVWQEVGGRRTAYFTSLPAGNGIFRVQARYGDAPFAQDDTAMASLRFVRAPRWYETTWASLFATLLLVMILIVVQGLLSRRARFREKELRSLVDQRTEELQEALIRVEANARIDTLTGVANRRHMDEQLTSVWNMARRSGAPVSLIMLDIDRFKQYNDSLGHNAGDECLRKIANAVKDKLLREHDMLARYGGEEFLIVLYNSDESGALGAAERILEGVRKLAIPHPSSDIAAIVTVSLGCATTMEVESDSDPHELIEAADRALYEAKNSGRNRACVSPDIIIGVEPPLSPTGAETAAANPELPDRNGA